MGKGGIRLFKNHANCARGSIDDLFSTDSDAQIIILGDFNDNESGGAIRALEGVFETGKLTRILDRIPVDQRYSFIRSGGRKDLIDHVLCSSSLAQYITNVKIMNESLQDQSALDINIPTVESDHAPIVFELNEQI